MKKNKNEDSATEVRYGKERDSQAKHRKIVLRK